MTEVLETVDVTQRVRPVRLGFLVPIASRHVLRQVIELNTCLWGGVFNGLIPVFPKTPQWSHDMVSRRTSPAKIRKGYIETFDPDFLVTPRMEMAKGLGVEKQYVITLGDFVNPHISNEFPSGLSAIEAYRDLRGREFKFIRTDRTKVALPSATDPAFSDLCGVCFGRFPTSKQLQHYKGEYVRALGADDVRIDADNLLAVARTMITPLKAGATALKKHSVPQPRALTFFLMDPCLVTDLMDLWNLRAIGWSIVPVPVQWRDRMAKACRRAVDEWATRYTHTYGQPPARCYGVHLLGSRSMEQSETRSFAAQIGAVLDPYVPLWDRTTLRLNSIDRCTLSAERSSSKSELTLGRVTFHTIAPSFVSDSVSSGPRWVNVVGMNSADDYSILAGHIPSALNDINSVLKPLEPANTRLSDEGIAVYCNMKDDFCTWSPPRSQAVFEVWLKSRGYEGEPVPAGHAARQVLRVLRNWHEISLIAHEGIVRLLDDMAEGLVECTVDTEVREKGRFSLKGHCATREMWLNALTKATNGNKVQAQRHFGSMLDRGILKIGLLLQCPVCQHRTWYPLGAIAETVKCEMCFGAIPFPSTAPPEQSQWRYRTQGVFASKGAAQGAYSVTLALRFLASHIAGRTTWTVGLQVRRKTRHPLEVDLALWRPFRTTEGSEQRLLLVECKTFGAFEQKDVSRARTLRKWFPEAVLVFATLNSTLQKAERTRLRSIVTAMRTEKHRDTCGYPSPVIILTAHELMSGYAPPRCWEDKGSVFAQAAKDYRGRDDLLELCRWTQYLHLGIDHITPDKDRPKTVWVVCNR